MPSCEMVRRTEARYCQVPCAKPLKSTRNVFCVEQSGTSTNTPSSSPETYSFDENARYSELVLSSSSCVHQETSVYVPLRNMHWFTLAIVVSSPSHPHVNKTTTVVNVASFMVSSPCREAALCRKLRKGEISPQSDLRSTTNKSTQELRVCSMFVLRTESKEQYA
jgi:hypothetical protein